MNNVLVVFIGGGIGAVARYLFTMLALKYFSETILATLFV